MKKLILIAVILFAGYSYFTKPHGVQPPGSANASLSQAAGRADSAIASAFADRRSNVQVSGQGVVARLLPDDNSGSRHQKFILRLSSGQTLLVAHNIDIAPRVSSLGEGDSIDFNGIYEWNEKGGVLHWTHRDPNGRHTAGWLRHRGQTYQ